MNGIGFFYYFFETLWKILFFSKTTLPKNQEPQKSQIYFSKITLPKSKVLVSMSKIGRRKLRCINNHAWIFLHEKSGCSEKSNFRFFDRFFKLFWLFSKTILTNLRFWFQKVKRVVRSSPASAVTPKFFYMKCYDPGKSRILEWFVKFFFSQKLPSRNESEILVSVWTIKELIVGSSTS